MRAARILRDISRRIASRPTWRLAGRYSMWGEVRVPYETLLQSAVERWKSRMADEWIENPSKVRPHIAVQMHGSSWRSPYTYEFDVMVDTSRTYGKIDWKAVSDFVYSLTRYGVLVRPVV